MGEVLFDETSKHKKFFIKKFINQIQNLIRQLKVSQECLMSCALSLVWEYWTLFLIYFLKDNKHMLKVKSVWQRKKT